MMLLYLTLSSALAQLQCLDAHKNIVNWSFTYRLPDSHATGVYAYVDSKADRGSEAWPPHLRAAGDSINNASTSALQITLTAAANTSNVSFLLYNDQPPTSKDVAENASAVQGKAPSSFGHTKGIVATDGKHAIWIVHSAPGFPRNTSSFEVPIKSPSQFGQTFLCMSLDRADLDQVGTYLMVSQAWVYNRTGVFADSDGARARDANLSTLAAVVNATNHRRNYDNYYKHNSTYADQTLFNGAFTAFSRSRSSACHFNASTNETCLEYGAIYENYIHEKLNVPLVAQTWLRQEAIGPVCGKTVNVLSMWAEVDASRGPRKMGH